MAKRKWIFGIVCLAIGILFGHMLTRVRMSTARPTAFDGIAIPLAISHSPEQEEANVDLTEMAFCHKISSVGNYLTYDHDEFTPGQEVLLYAEIANFHSEANPEGGFRTVLKSKLEIFREGQLQEPVKCFDFPETVDICRRRRVDYFHSYQITMPENLTAGQYVLRLTVQDRPDRREDSRSLKFAVR